MIIQLKIKLEIAIFSKGILSILLFQNFFCDVPFLLDFCYTQIHIMRAQNILRLKQEARFTKTEINYESDFKYV